MENRTTIQISEDLRKELKILASQRDVSYQDLIVDMVSVFKELNREKTIISIPKKLAKKVRENISGTDIKSTSEFVTFILRMILADDDESEIRKKLKTLGYL